MKHLLAIAMLMLPLAGCRAPEYQTATYARVTMLSEFSATIVDHDLWVRSSQYPKGRNSKLVISSDGRVSGRIDGMIVTGTWEWIEGAYCSQVRVGSTSFPYVCKEVWMEAPYLRLSSRLDPEKYSYYEVGDAN